MEKYSVEGDLGAGGFGTVEVNQLAKEFAKQMKIKSISGNFTEEDAGLLANEMQSLDEVHFVETRFEGKSFSMLCGSLTTC